MAEIKFSISQKGEKSFTIDSLSIDDLTIMYYGLVYQKHQLNTQLSKMQGTLAAEKIKPTLAHVRTLISAMEQGVLNQNVKKAL
jgi:hypothetical protein